MPPSDDFSVGDHVNTPYGAAEVVEVMRYQVAVRLPDGRTGTFFKDNVEVVVKR